jgi:hypothetical protein
MSYSNNGERWTIVAIKELADHLQVTDENHWKKFAQHVGFNKNEIKTKLQVRTKLTKSSKCIHIILFLRLRVIHFWQ